MGVENDMAVSPLVEYLDRETGVDRLWPGATDPAAALPSPTPGVPEPEPGHHERRDVGSERRVGRPSGWRSSIDPTAEEIGERRQPGRGRHLSADCCRRTSPPPVRRDAAPRLQQARAPRTGPSGHGRGREYPWGLVRWRCSPR